MGTPGEGSNADWTPSNDFCQNFEQAIADFDLSVFNSSYDIAEVPVSEVQYKPVLSTFNKTESLEFRISQIEEEIGIFNLVFWGVHQTDRAAEILSSLCRDLFHWDISERDFLVIHRVKARKIGVLVKLPSLSLKQRLLAKSIELSFHGIFVGLD